MTVRTTRFGGTDWSDGEILYAADLNNTFGSCLYVVATDASGGSTSSSTTATQISKVVVPANTITSHIVFNTLLASITVTTGTSYSIWIGTSGSETLKTSDIHAGSVYQIPNPDEPIATDMSSTITYYYAPSAGEKSTGFNVLVKGKTTGAGTATIYCRQSFVMGA